MATLTSKQLKKLMKESVKEALKEEMTKLRALSVGEVSTAEQKDIEKRYGKTPSRKKTESYTLEI